LPQLIERAGNGKAGGGSITGFYTVLSEGDDQQDPVADSARAILDGHFVLSRQIAESGVYPAIDIEQSISRVMNDIVSRDQLQAARYFKQLYSRYLRNRDLINVGAYMSGSDPMLDKAIQLHPVMQEFLMQEMRQSHDYQESIGHLFQLVNGAN
jgi:flagellum-specific ATP synthase